ATAVSSYVRFRHAKKIDGGTIQKLCLEIPERHIKRRDCHGSNTLASVVTHLLEHGHMQSRNFKSRTTQQAVIRKLIGKQCRGFVAVGISNSDLVSSVDLAEHQGGGIPLECSI